MEEKLALLDSSSGVPPLGCAPSLLTLPLYLSTSGAWEERLEVQPVSGTDGRSMIHGGQGAGSVHTTSGFEAWGRTQVSQLLVQSSFHTTHVPPHFGGKSGGHACRVPPTHLTCFLPTDPEPCTKWCLGRQGQTPREKGSEGQACYSEHTLRGTQGDASTRNR